MVGMGGGVDEWMGSMMAGCRLGVGLVFQDKAMLILLASLPIFALFHSQWLVDVALNAQRPMPVLAALHLHIFVDSVAEGG